MLNKQINHESTLNALIYLPFLKGKQVNNDLPLRSTSKASRRPRTL